MIRTFHADDMTDIMVLWLETTIAAHPFINKQYWIDAKSLVENEYLPQSETWVYEDRGEIKGFISILQHQIIGAIFVKQTAQKQGIGQQLIRHVQLRYALLLLEVYTENKQAYDFYQKMGFKTINEKLNNETQSTLATMSYQHGV